MCFGLVTTAGLSLPELRIRASVQVASDVRDIRTGGVSGGFRTLHGKANE